MSHLETWMQYQLLKKLMMLGVAREIVFYVVGASQNVVAKKHMKI
jgi:hypothetical protein